MVRKVTAESELVSGTSCAQEMLYAMRVMESLGLKVKKSMILEMDSKAAVDLANNWSVGTDLFTKNLDRPAFEKHTKVCCGNDAYMK
jgi:hypothetical protein